MIRCNNRIAELRGFTLVEMIITLSVVSVVVTILAGIFVTNSEMYGMLARSSDDCSELRLAYSRISLELMSVRDRRSVMQAGDASMEFITVEGDRTDIEFDPGKSEITLNGHTLAGKMSSFSLKYYDSSGRELKNPRVKPETDIWSIELEMIGSGAGGSKMISRVHPRNFLQ